MTEETRFKKKGLRFYKADGGSFIAFIFGAPAPVTLWAWAVWSNGKVAEGVQFSLRLARKRALEEIHDLGEKAGCSEKKDSYETT